MKLNCGGLNVTAFHMHFCFYGLIMVRYFTLLYLTF